MVDGDENAELTLLFLCGTQAENDLNELKALMHSPNAIVVRAPDSLLVLKASSGTSVVVIFLARVAPAVYLN